MTPVDMLGNEIKEGDIVVSFNHLYVVKSIRNKNYIKVILRDPSPTTRAKDVYTKFTVVVTPLVKQ